MENQIHKIFDQLGIKVKSISSISNGQVNLVYIVNDKYVLRLPKKGKSPDYLTEKKIHELLSFLPIPRIIKVDTTKRVVSSPYMIETLISGELWLESDGLETDEKLYLEAGRLLRELHKKKFEFVTDFDLRRRISWARLFNKLIQQEQDTLPQNLKIKCKLQQGEDSSERVYCLDDFNEGNIMVNNSNITGIIDLEQLRITPVDFCLVQVLERMFDFSLPVTIPFRFKHQKLADHFLQGYRKKLKITEDLLKKYLYYNYTFMFNRVNDENKKIYAGKIQRLIKAEQ